MSNSIPHYILLTTKGTLIYFFRCKPIFKRHSPIADTFTMFFSFTVKVSDKSAHARKKQA